MIVNIKLKLSNTEMKHFQDAWNENKEIMDKCIIHDNRERFISNRHIIMHYIENCLSK